MVTAVLFGLFAVLLLIGAPIAVCLGMSSVAAMIVMGAGLACWQHFVHAGTLVTVAGGLLTGVALYFVMCLVLKVDELKLLKSLIKR